MKGLIKRLSVFFYWLLLEYLRGLTDLLKLKGFGKRSDDKYQQHWLFSKTVFLVLMVLYYITSNKWVGFILLLTIIYMFYLSEYEKEIWVGWWRNKKAKEENIPDKKPWYLRRSKKDII